MNARLLSLTAACGLCLTQTSIAQSESGARQLQYTYLEFGAAIGIPDQKSYLLADEFGTPVAEVDLGEAAIFTLSGSYQASEYVFAEASITSSKQDFTVSNDFFAETTNSDIDIFAFGVGARYPLQERLDVYGVLGFAKVDGDIGGTDISAFGDDDGFTYRVGIRAMATDMVELGIQYSKLDIDDLLAADGVGAELRLHVNDRFSLGFDVLKGDDATTVGVGARFGF